MKTCLGVNLICLTEEFWVVLDETTCARATSWTLVLGRQSRQDMLVVFVDTSYGMKSIRRLSSAATFDETGNAFEDDLFPNVL